MTEQECLDRMIAPGTKRPGKYRQGVIQIHLTRACDKACFGCTQGSQLAGKVEFMPLDAFRVAVASLRGYFGVVGIFGGNPALHPEFDGICEILREHFDYRQRGIWTNHPKGNGKIMRHTFDPSVSNLNVHLDKEAYREFKRDWPECQPVGLHTDSRHAPPFVAMKDVILDEGERHRLISDCDINKHWSAMIGMFRGELRAWFCEIAGAQSILHQGESDYPDTGHAVVLDWWKKGMHSFARQVEKHCHECGVPLRIRGELSQASEICLECKGTGKIETTTDTNVEFRTYTPCRKCAKEQVSETHVGVYNPKRKGRRVELVTVNTKLDTCGLVTDYIGNAKR